MRPRALLTEKALVAGACGTLVALLLLAVVGIFVPLEWSRFALWVARARVRRGSRSARSASALGVVAREVQAASLLAFVLSLPLAFLAVVPEGSVSQTLYDVISAISARSRSSPRSTRSPSALGDGAWAATSRTSPCCAPRPTRAGRGARGAAAAVRR